MPKRLKRTILYGGYLLFVTLLLLEIGIRLWGYSERYIYDPIYTNFEPSEDIPYVHKPNLVQMRGQGLAVINTDVLGLRTKTAGEHYGLKRPQDYRIAIVGDSVTFGEGVSKTEHTYAQVLEDLLNQQQDRWKVKVFNFGASAYSVKQMAATLPHRMIDIQPDLVVMALIPGDFNLFRTPLINKKGYFYKPIVSLLPPDSFVRDVFRNVHLLYLVRNIALTYLSPSSTPLSNGKIPESYRYVKQFKETATRLRLSYLIVLLPRGNEKAWSYLPKQLTQDGISYLDLSGLGKLFTDEQFRASRFDPHPSAAVHGQIAKSLADYVQHLPAFSHDSSHSN